MARAVPTLGYPSKTAACVALAASGLSVNAIAERLETKPVNVSALLGPARYRVGTRTLLLPAELAARLEAPAGERGMTVPELVAALLDTIAREDLVEALLGEPGAGDA